jgi:hypothetical protein
MISLFKQKKETAAATGSDHDRQLTGPETAISRLDAFTQKIDEISATTATQFGEKLLSLIAKENEIIQGVIFMADHHQKPVKLKFLCGYACNREACSELSFEPGEGWPGQVFNDQAVMQIKDFPEGYMKIRTGLGEASPRSLLLFPILQSGRSTGVAELASFKEFTAADEEFYRALSEPVAQRLASLQTKKSKAK